MNHTDRPRFESFVAAQSGLTGTIRDMTTVRSMLGTQPSANRSSYLAVQYLEMPLAPEYEAVMSGLDLSSVEYVAPCFLGAADVQLCGALMCVRLCALARLSVFGSVFDAMSRQAFRDNTCVWFRTVITVRVSEQTLTNACPVRHCLALRDLCARYCGTASCVSV